MVCKVSVFLLVVLAVSHLVLSSPYFDEDENEQQPGAGAEQSDVNYFDSPSENDLMESAQKRSCIRRSGSCDHRRNDCCFSSSCRCNLWGSNCRCQRAGLFQKWG